MMHPTPESAKRTATVVLWFAMNAVIAPAHADYAPGTAPFINSWLVIGPFDAPSAEVEASESPAAGVVVAGQPWRYFDDRLFSRNLDDYQDLRSYFHLKRGVVIDSKVVYAHAYIFSPRSQIAQLRASAHAEFHAWLNGIPVAAGFLQPAQDEGFCGEKDNTNALIRLRARWNRLLLRVRNHSPGRLGFYARFSDIHGNQLPGVVWSVAGGGPLGISTGEMEDIGTRTLPVAFREWTYVGCDVADLYNLQEMYSDPEALSMYSHWNETGSFVQASDFQLLAHGGEPPYCWKLTGGQLPRGLELSNAGTLSGIPAKSNRLGSYHFTTEVTDNEQHTATKELSIELQERPNRWYDEAGLTGLIHSPERIPADGYKEFAQLMKRQGYQIGIPVAFNNGDGAYRWPSSFDLDRGLGDVLTPLKQALVAEGIPFGMYMGPLFGDSAGPEAPVQMMEEAMQTYEPVVLWFDWGIAIPSTDSLFSLIKTIHPQTLIILNGQNFGKFRFRNGDFDVTTFEGWTASDQKMDTEWPYEITWPKLSAIESWRLIPESGWENTKDRPADAEVALRVQLSLIGEGHIANTDATPSLLGKRASLENRLVNLDGELIESHRKMADWASPPGLPPIYPSFTKVRPGPLSVADWGYNTVNVDRNRIYLHVMTNGRGKTGMPVDKQLVCGPVYRQVASVVWMQPNRSLPFQQDGSRLTIDAQLVEPDPIDTVIEVVLGEQGQSPGQSSKSALHVLAHYRMGEYFGPETGILPDRAGAADMRVQGQPGSVSRETPVPAVSDLSVRLGDAESGYFSRSTIIPRHFSYVLEAYVKPTVATVQRGQRDGGKLVRIVTNGTAEMGVAIAAQGDEYGIWAGYGGFIGSGVKLDPQCWVHVALVHDFSFRQRRTVLLMNHKAVAETAVNPEPQSGARIGGSEAGDIWTGLIDEVRFSTLNNTFEVGELLPVPDKID
jgi:hypothetical protein